MQVAIADDERSKIAMKDFLMDDSEGDINVGCYDWPKVPTSDGNEENLPKFVLKYKIDPPLDSLDVVTIGIFFDKFLDGIIWIFKFIWKLNLSLDTLEFYSVYS